MNLHPEGEDYIIYRIKPKGEKAYEVAVKTDHIAGGAANVKMTIDSARQSAEAYRQVGDINSTDYIGNMTVSQIMTEAERLPSNSNLSARQWVIVEIAQYILSLREQGYTND